MELLTSNSHECDLSIGAVFPLILSTLVFGFIVGVFYGYHLAQNGNVSEVKCHGRHPNQEMLQHSNRNDRNGPGNDGSMDVLAGAVELFRCQWQLGAHANSKSKDGHNNKVVEYLPPSELLSKLFHNDSKESGIGSSLSLNHRDTTIGRTVSTSTQKTNQFLSNLKSIQRYSVKTSHTFFFNQLFGALDPVSLAAELIALGLNTSPYTYETAPVVTMLERDVIQCLARLVFDGDCCNKSSGACTGAVDEEEGETKNTAVNTDQGYGQYDGLMLPGGSLSNLTALHVARHYARSLYRGRPDRGQSEASSTMFVEQEEEKKSDEFNSSNSGFRGYVTETSAALGQECERQSSLPELVAFVSTEAHYSFQKAASVIGLGSDNLIAIPTMLDGQMDANALDQAIRNAKSRGLLPFFVGVTAGSTVRGSYDDIESISAVCRNHEHAEGSVGASKIWLHVDGAWGGAAIFSQRADVRNLLNGVETADSFTMNPHKMLGAPQQTTTFVTRHQGLMKSASSTGAKYLFDTRKHGAEYDLGDDTFTCGRRSDALKFWALWKYHGLGGLNDRINSKVDALSQFACAVRGSDAFALACKPWPFNVNFFYLPKRMRILLKKRRIQTDGNELYLPDDLSEEMANVSVTLKLRLHESGEMIIPYQPLSNQKADCFRLVLAGMKTFEDADINRLMSMMDRFGADL